MTVALANPKSDQGLPRANVRHSADAYPAEQYVTIPNVPIFAEHETKSPEGRPVRFDRARLERLIARGNERIRRTGDYAAVTIGHTHDPDEGLEQPEVIGGMGPYRLGLLGEPNQPTRYCILADFHIQKDRVDQYNSHPRRSVELWYEKDEPFYIDPICLLSETPQLDLGLAPLIDAKGDDGADMRLLYSASWGERRVRKYSAAAAACPSSTNVFVPGHEGGEKPRHYAAGTPENQSNKEPNIMLAPEDIRQIVDAIEELDWVAAVKNALPKLEKLDQLLEHEQQEQAEGLPTDAPPPAPEEEIAPETGAAANPPAETPPAAPPLPPTPETSPEEPPQKFAAGEQPSDKISKPKAEEMLENPPHGKPLTEPQEKMLQAAAHKYAKGGDAVTDPKPKEEKANPNAHLDDMSEEEIERYLCERKKKRYALAEGSVDGTDGKKPSPAEATVAPANDNPGEGSASGESQTDTKAKYSALEMKIAELERDRIARTDEARKARLTQLRYHRAFDLDKEIKRCAYAAGMNDEAFKSHCELLAEVATPTLANQPMPVPDEISDGRPPAAAVRQQPERYTKEARDKAIAYVLEQSKLGKAVSYETVIENIVAGRAPE